ncbi:Transmembrane emp24 domain-containing protein p24delta5 [Hibiscus syriacus]|uniref:Transmembrane emp24 domain-containing protein p24delta5 n=1 Tax=Hibiscus syriacus TaxID=106335 RepID=A0A6A3BFD0_HIBSY|nr:transmembrane emp24 domain-containing protein p24delta5-like [Hibiscus syriacus]KAE8713429.1 Transmembrane emp24 domain-containing protein p24delta5 [Hibiscus syriacus]
MFYGGRAACLLPIILVLCLTRNNCMLPVAEAIWLTIPSSGTKCVSEEIQSNVVVLADYYVIDEHNPDHIPTISARVTSPFGNNLHHNENATHGQFAFTTSESGNYIACFWKDGSHKQHSELTLGVDWKIGIAAKDWDSAAKKEKIEGVELILRRLQGTVEAIRGNLIYLKDREADMREVSEITNARVAWFSIISLGVCIAVTVLQIWYLKRYFVKKKLI